MSLLFGAIQQGCFYGIVSMGVFLSFRILRIPDLTADGAFTLGGSIGASLILAKQPLLALPASIIAGCCAGFVTAFLQVKMRVLPILAGILTMSGLYTVNLAVQGGVPNLSLLREKTIFSFFSFLSRKESKFLWPLLCCLVAVLVLTLFLHTEKGLEIRCVGTNPNMARAQGINVGLAKTLTLMLSNGCIAFAGCLASQYQGYSDINSGTGTLLIGLSGLILGETIFPKVRFSLKLLAVVVGAIIYQLVISLVIRYSIFPAYGFKLLSACLIAVLIGFSKRKNGERENLE